jgi:hypothetical protein
VVLLTVDADLLFQVVVEEGFLAVVGWLRGEGTPQVE